ncbi:MAG: cobalamin transport system substrate-binding protein [Tenuifilum sp.]|jgi:iron complex transport system substrate-binding protein|nr:cobalamin transport system substrate-binding protein [Tenuifilum sp.]
MLYFLMCLINLREKVFKMRMRYIIFAFTCLLLATSCNHSSKKNAVEHSRKNAEYAVGFDFEESDSKIKVSVKSNSNNIADVQTYWLTHDSSRSDSDNIITIPVKRVVCMSSTHVGYISELLSDSVIVGISGTQFVNNSRVYSRVEKGEIAEVGYGQTLNYELLSKLKPDVVFVFNVNGEATSYIEKMRELGLKVVSVSDFLENSPLGRAEWIRFFGLFLDKKDLADSIFSSVKNSYNRFKLVANSEINNKIVFLNLPYRDIWYFPGADNYFVKFIDDARGKYCFQEIEGVSSYPMSTEVAYKVGLNSDIWLNTGDANSLNDIEQVDKRFTNFKPYQTGEVYNNNKRIGKGGGNDFWEYGAVHPELILRDIIKIIHPDLLPSDTLFFYQKLK